MSEYEKMKKLMEYAETLGIFIENFEISQKVEPEVVYTLRSNKAVDFVPRQIATTIKMTAKSFPVPEKPECNGTITHIGNFDE